MRAVARVLALCAACALVPVAPAFADGMSGEAGPIGMVGGANSPAAAGEMDLVSVVIDQTRIVRLERPAAMVIVGNPTIADVTLRDPVTVFVLGRSFGVTNIIALDAEGNEIANKRVSVSPVKGSVVTVSRGAKQFNYACTENCQPMLVPGDAAFAELIEQAVKKLGFGTDVARASGEGQ